LIRHARIGLLSLAVLALPIAMIEPPFRALLVSPIGTPPLTPAGKLTALRAAIAVSAITVCADKENRMTQMLEAHPLPEHCFAMNRRHASSQAGLDNGSRFVAL
jgi:hypothetical protein